jgi:hypothetical protein
MILRDFDEFLVFGHRSKAATTLVQVILELEVIFSRQIHSEDAVLNEKT